MSNKKPIVMIAAVVAIAVIGFLIAGQQEKVAVQKDVKLGIIFGFSLVMSTMTSCVTVEESSSAIPMKTTFWNIYKEKNISSSAIKFK